ncbi:snRNA-activating protein complex subunit 4 [Vespa crabro]|uniref:snRNA-activating protein complex subunit 4 n=1 Tax=Vespa crabro TaxID=7445 RepID=UPI001F00FD35|nr:snRNA-activating protein complex subunit 4 [Vespa crabro]
MSDSEDSNIVGEIKDLENVLATIPANLKSPEKSSIETIHEFSQIDGSFEESKTPEDLTIDKLKAALDLNKQMIEKLMNTKNEVSAILEDCEEQLQMIDEKMKKYVKHWTNNSKSNISAAGMPYFKDKNCFAAPKNHDTKLKAARGELQIANFQKACIWTIKDRKVVLNTVYEEVMVSILENSHNEGMQESKVNNIISSEDTFKRMLKARNVDEIIGPLGEKKFDWLKIAAMNVDGRHSADECSVMWNILLHPDINKSKWTRTEESKLKKIAKLYRYEDWDNIAKKLDTKRSGYQCFVKYTSMGNLLKLTERTWTMKEDERLCDIVAKCRIGNFVPWAEVMSYMNFRPKQQLYFRWMFKLAPHLKKGRFTKAESETLLQGVHKFGTNFSLIAAQLMPDRTSIQLNDHYQTLTSKGSTHHWTLQADMKLIDLYKKIGPDWSKIAKNFKYKNRTQLRHRYTALYKYASKGLSIFEIPRPKNENLSKMEDAEFSDKEYCVDVIENDIDDKLDELLIEHFQNLSTIKSSHNENFYYDSQKLCRDTKELYSILESLQADLHIPDNFDYLPLIEIDKQLLYSLKTYIKSKFEKQNSNKEVEAFKLKMFGLQNNEEQKVHFIPPLPFGAYADIKNHKQTKSIDYVFDTNKKFVVDVNMEFNTPELIIHFIGGLEEHIQFNKISTLYCNKKDKCEQQRIIQSINNTHTKFNVHKNNNFPNSTEIDKSCSLNVNNQLNFTQPKNYINKNNYLVYKVKTTVYESFGESSLWVSPMDHKKELVNVLGVAIKPNYITLSTYRNLVTLKNIYDIENISNNVQSNYKDIEKAYKSEKAYELLKRRLIQLFKYPICMSYLSLEEMNNTTGSSLEESKNVVCNKRKTVQKNRIRAKRVKENPSEKFICDTNMPSIT